MTEIHLIVLRKLRKGPVHSRSFRQVKSVITQLVASGHVERVAMETDKKVYVGLTDKGAFALDKEQS